MKTVLRLGGYDVTHVYVDSLNVYLTLADADLFYQHEVTPLEFKTFIYSNWDDDFAMGANFVNGKENLTQLKFDIMVKEGHLTGEVLTPEQAKERVEADKKERFPTTGTGMNGVPLRTGDNVIVPDPIEGDLHNHEFAGYIQKIRPDGLADVEDGDGDVYSIELERLTLDE